MLPVCADEEAVCVDCADVGCVDKAEPWANKLGIIKKKKAAAVKQLQPIFFVANIKKALPEAHL